MSEIILITVFITAGFFLDKLLSFILNKLP